MAEIPFVDTHVHFWDLKNPSLAYVWLEPDWVHPIIGDVDGLKVIRYGADEFIAETRFQNVSKAVHVQAAIGIEDPVNETKWLQAYADRTGHPHGIVAHCDLAADDAASVLERHYEYANIRGIRDFGEGDYLVDDNWHRGYSLLEKYGYVFCLDPVWENLEKTRDLALKFPGITLCVDHAGFPRARDDEYFRNWRGGIESAAEAENIIIKISGLGMCDPTWTVDSIRPWVLACVDAFGVERSFFGTNWPIDSLYSSYGDVLDAYDEIIADFSDDDRTALFSANAERFFRL